MVPKGDIVIVNIKTSTYDIYMGRGSLWGNPFAIGKDGDRDEVCDKHKKMLQDMNKDELDQRLVRLELRMTRCGGRLGCFCVPKRCHVENWVELLLERRERIKNEQD